MYTCTCIVVSACYWLVAGSCGSAALNCGFLQVVVNSGLFPQACAKPQSQCIVLSWS